MMLATEMLIRSFAEELIENLRKNMSANTGASLFWRFDGVRLQVGSTLSWITVLEDGRPPGRWPPRKAIREWVGKINITSDVSPDSLAFLIQRSIGEKGTLLWQRGGRSGVLSEYLNQQYVQQNLVGPLREQLMNTIVETLLR